ncbi:RNA polymerase sigma 70 [Saccharopolyspora rectivirgula]|jgi:RNA polymerase sigma-70 factor (ECF subfamily)|uniref:RNA polymerase sigma factor n=1 Tax=Saccharopolyspora rectivirgula TaxID=28042 RepID=A0A073B7J3_9PSEU|nr:RNA polymerase sigma 70 [Saccharopolyspora rectivirgula]
MGWGSSYSGRVVELTDAVLAQRVAAGDANAFEHLVRRYSRELLGLAVRMLEDRAEAEDVVQDVLLTAWQRSAELSDPAALRAWLFQVARRRCLMVLRSRRSRRTELVAVLPERSTTLGESRHIDPQRAAEAGAGVRALGRALAGLPARQRDVWLLAEVAGLSSDEISVRIGAGESVVRGRLCRARTKLAGAMRSWR